MFLAQERSLRKLVTVLATSELMTKAKKAILQQLP